ncbi:MAG: DinB family protein [Ginsengibacter sp.]
MESSRSKLLYPPHFIQYIHLVDNENLQTLLEKQGEDVVSFLKSIPVDKRLYKYEEGKWTVQEVLQHVIDCERVFHFRALVFSRKDPNTFPSFDENNYIKFSNANNKNWENLIGEFIAVRKSTEYLFNSFSQDQLDQMGKASNYEMNVNALGYLIAGHLAHHINILKERYLDV